MSDTVPVRRAPVWQTILGLIVSAALLWWSLRNVSFSQVQEHLAEARPWPIVIGVICATTTFFLRIFRWQLLLRAEDGSRLPARPLWHAIAMGFMANNILPLRIGEVVRTFAGSRLTGTRFTAVFASIAVERLFDALTVVLLMGIGLLLAGIPTDSMIGGVSIPRLVSLVGAVTLAALVAAGLVVAFPKPAERLVRRLVPMSGIGDKIVAVIEGITHGLSALRSPLRIAGVIFWSLALWLLSAFSFWVAFKGFNIPVNFAGALLMQGLIMFGIAVPSTPGYLGVFEAPIIAVLGLYGVDPSLAATYAFTYHATTFLPITLLGAWSVLSTNLGLRQLRQGGQ